MARPRIATPLARLWTPPYMATLVAAVIAFYINYSGTTIDIELPAEEGRWGGVSQILQAVPVSLYVLLASFLAGFALIKAADALRWRALKGLFSYQGWLYHPNSYKTKVIVICRHKLNMHSGGIFFLHIHATDTH